MREEDGKGGREEIKWEGKKGEREGQGRGYLQETKGKEACTRGHKCLGPSRTVFAQVMAGFRYGRDDLDVLGVNFRRDLIDVRVNLLSTIIIYCHHGNFKQVLSILSQLVVKKV